MEVEASKYPDASSQLDIIRECLDYGWTDIVITFRFPQETATLNADYLLSIPEKKRWLEQQGACHKETFRVVERNILSRNGRVEYHWLFEDPKHAALFSLRYS